jgi:hypothetical protein
LTEEIFTREWLPPSIRRTCEIFLEIYEMVLVMCEVESLINTLDSDVVFDPVPEVLRKDMQFVVDLLTLNALNEDDRKIMTVIEGSKFILYLMERKLIFTRSGGQVR